MQNTFAAPINWRFITPFAPWQGGVYERLVGLTKTAFRKAVGRRLLDGEEFKTLVVECEAIVNSRPLTYVDSASERILRPVDFLRPQAIIAAQGLRPEHDKGLQHIADRRDKLLGLWKATISSLERFWKIWIHDYLMSLRERHCMEHQQPSRVTDREIVIVAEEGLPRAEWKLGKVQKLHKNHGGKIKAVDDKMPNGHVLKTPVSMFCPLEVSEEEREMQPTTKSKEFVKHLGDQSLQAEETEEEEESRTKLKTARTWYAHALSIVLVILSATFALTSSAPTNLQCKIWPRPVGEDTR
uniref:DUF5641 domain-containing protein n=1 Tax=Parascaris univalens TaxID=6257 RepID=A0A915BVD3_PARUN